ncbi:ferredoxin [Streptomyces sp. NBC_01102]|uniref:ferredoxin n=1 Tax=unclassified Streptomyces TaxID=2593676 RepID=UPI00386DCF23|nr:ferredoxin [Streptomyces sp. NBC_01102]
MRVHVHPDRCIGAGLCVMSAPAVFDQDDDSGLVVLLDDSPAGADADHARKIAEHICPSKAIGITGG